MGASEIALRCFLLPVLNEYRENYPNVRVRISNFTTPQALDALKDRRVDFAVVTSPIEQRQGICCKSLQTFEEIAVCGERLSGQMGGKVLSLLELSQYPLISLGSKTSTFGLYSELFLGRGIPFAPDIEAATADQILPLVRHNLGIGFVPKEFLRTDTEGVFPVALKERLPQREICLVTRKKGVLGPCAKALIGMIV